VEAGLRSFDRTMPEENNRLLTDQLSDLLFTHSEESHENLLREGVPEEKVHFVGNVMIDTIVRLLPRVEDRRRLSTLRRVSDEKSSYYLFTLHRPSNVDDPDILSRLMATLEDISEDLLVIFPVHPRTRKRLKGLKFKTQNSRFKLVEPLSYLDFLAFQRHATVVITDSGGIQEETTYLHVPCLTLRENTERPVTVEVGTNILVGQDMEYLKTEVQRILEGAGKKGSIPPLWDGKASERLVDKLYDNNLHETQNELECTKDKRCCSHI
jgi:UDP-N-acetylglucosamine 2-epimerase (non-hydrolysing)